MDFKDNFSTQAEIYAKYRPDYPTDLFTFLALLTPQHDVAWDCGTGNGQAAIGLSGFYNAVIATDPSPQQIGNCFLHPRVKYLVERAEDFTHPAASIDLITIANALHWFEFDKFYDIVRRVLKKDGIIAAWAYSIPSVSEEVDAITKEFHYQTMDEFWLPENRLVEKGYATIPFPFIEISSPKFIAQKEFTRSDFLAYLNTWSATQKFIIKYGYNPTDQLLKQLQPVWQDEDEKKTFRWDLILKVGGLA